MPTYKACSMFTGMVCFYLRSHIQHFVQFRHSDLWGLRVKGFKFQGLWLRQEA